jgi:hypothetical protein
MRDIYLIMVVICILNVAHVPESNYDAHISTLAALAWRGRDGRSRFASDVAAAFSEIYER